ncbi:Ankyrin repeat-containing domain protein [Cordyceps fumosorosea ARSEF 2679]|uniref:Ankyrin repeat-containing domain protein n=1 Tax=Cordyceps fumosorosea (strain ARSEF 2679) TaxID=1081104 RepID=A0A167D1A9_CORFA|nr:Ankyrin repeat-containing domain protein [Cordyceps fumosorosea ARSEF 2679]OAA41831.1 Ankyrin repeat-containing domain protein [Cordyceps fumosorosea ARSEF 2679]
MVLSSKTTTVDIPGPTAIPAPTSLSFELRQKYDSNGEVIKENFVTVGLASPVLSDEEADSFCEDEVETLGQELQSASFEDGDFHVVMKYGLNSEFDEHTELASAMIVSAACTGDAGDLASFLDRSPNRHALIRKQDEKGRSLLHLAVPNGHRDVVEYLIGEGCNTNAVDKLGRTPLMEAALWGHPDLVEMLLDAGADKDKRDKRGMIAGRFAEESARNEKERHQRSTIKYSEDPFTKKQDRTLIRTLLRHSPPPRPSYQSISAGDLQGAYFHKSPSVGTISLVMPRLGIELFSQRKTAAILFRGVPFPLVAAVSGRTGNPATEFRAPEAGFQMLSEGYWGGSENFGVAADMGFSFPHDARDARGKPGSYYASHAEAQLMCFFVRRNYLFREDRPIKSVLDDPNPPPEPVHDDFLQLFLAQPRKREATIAVSKDPCFSCTALRDCIEERLGIEFLLACLPVR